MGAVVVGLLVGKCDGAGLQEGRGDVEGTISTSVGGTGLVVVEATSSSSSSL